MFKNKILCTAGGETGRKMVDALRQAQGREDAGWEIKKKEDF